MGSRGNQVIINLSRRTLSNLEKTVLSKGLGFVPTPRSVAYLDLIANVEDSLRTIDQDVARTIKGGIANLLAYHAYRPIRNMTKLETRTLKELKNSEDIIITKADKGNVTVVLDKHEYLDKVTGMLQDGSYEPITYDPTDSIRKSLKQLVEEFTVETRDNDLKKLAHWLKFHKNFKSPELFCLPKVHKQNVPYRPIISCRNSVTQKLATILSGLLRPLIGKRSSHVRNSALFCEELKSLPLEEDTVMVSYDVKDLFTSIPVKEMLDLTLSYLEKDTTLPSRSRLNPFHVTRLIRFCIEDGNYFHFRGSFYRQTRGLPMGSPLSPTLAEMFMEDLEERAFTTGNPEHFPVFFKRYVDDIFAITKMGNEVLFMEHLNRIYPGNIIFTLEKEVEGKLPFLDTLVV
uniref:Reverse transcriptase domain-containing protein n=1 Tax=Trichuris muris TaxID=70415 RepID=A0A5S6QHR6_TRIMR